MTDAGAKEGFQPHRLCVGRRDQAGRPSAPEPDRGPRKSRRQGFPTLVPPPMPPGRSWGTARRSNAPMRRPEMARAWVAGRRWGAVWPSAPHPTHRPFREFAAHHPRSGTHRKRPIPVSPGGAEVDAAVLKTAIARVRIPPWAPPPLPIEGVPRRFHAARRRGALAHTDTG